MKKVITVVAVVFGLVNMVSAGTEAKVAEKLPAAFKNQISKQISYPSFAEEAGLEGEVWIEVSVNENNVLEIVDLSATNQELGQHVKDQISNVMIKKANVEPGKVYIMKVTFDN